MGDDDDDDEEEEEEEEDEDEDEDDFIIHATLCTKSPMNQQEKPFSRSEMSWLGWIMEACHPKSAANIAKDRVIDDILINHDNKQHDISHNKKPPKKRSPKMGATSLGHQMLRVYRGEDSFQWLEVFGGEDFIQNFCLMEEIRLSPVEVGSWNPIICQVL